MQADGTAHMRFIQCTGAAVQATPVHVVAATSRLYRLPEPSLCQGIQPNLQIN